MRRTQGLGLVMFLLVCAAPLSGVGDAAPHPGVRVCGLVATRGVVGVVAMAAVDADGGCAVFSAAAG